MNLKLVALFLTIGATIGQAQQPLPEQVIVKRLDLNLARKEAYQGELLWDNFANRDEIKPFNRLLCKNWQTDAPLFSIALIEKAKMDNLDSEVLKKCLDILVARQEERYAYVPVAAYFCRKGKESVWVILRVWEYASSSRREVLGHIQIDAIAAKSLRIVGSKHCD